MTTPLDLPRCKGRREPHASWTNWWCGPYITWTDHGRERLAERGYTSDEVRQIVHEPEDVNMRTYRGKVQEVRQLGNLRLVIDPRRRRAITIMTADNWDAG